MWEVKGFRLQTLEISIATIITDNDARPSPPIGRATTFGYIPHSVFHCPLKNSVHATMHHSKLRCFYFQIECFLSRYVPFTDLKVTFLSPFGTLSTWALLMNHLSPHLTSQPGTQAVRNISQEREMARNRENHSWLYVLRGSFGKGNQKALQVHSV